MPSIASFAFQGVKLFTLLIISAFCLAGTAAPKEICERILEPPTTEEMRTERSHFEAMFTLALALGRNHGEQAIEIRPKLKKRAFVEFFNRDMSSSDQRDLHLRTFFGSGDEVPEIEIFRPATSEKREKFYGLISTAREPLYTWTKSEIKTQIGLIAPGVTDMVVRRYVAIRKVEHQFRVEIGMDVDCKDIGRFAEEGAKFQHVVTLQGIFCRLPVMRGEW